MFLDCVSLILSLDTLLVVCCDPGVNTLFCGGCCSPNGYLPGVLLASGVVADIFSRLVVVFSGPKVREFR